MKKKIIIIGAGTAGLACGIRLQTLGFQCEIYEKTIKSVVVCIKFARKAFLLM